MLGFGPDAPRLSMNVVLKKDLNVLMTMEQFGQRYVDMMNAITPNHSDNENEGQEDG